MQVYVARLKQVPPRTILCERRSTVIIGLDAPGDLEAGSFKPEVEATSP
jgi:hypothetical protein